METKKTTLYLNCENIKKLKIEALEKNISLSSIVDKLITEYLKEKKMSNWELEYHLMDKESKVDYFDEPRVTFLYDKEKKLYYSDKWENSSYVHFCPISRKLNREIELFYKRIGLFHFISKTEMSTKKKAIEYLKKYKDKNIFTEKEFSVLVDCYIYLKIDLVQVLLEGVSSDYERIEELKGISNSFLFGYMLEVQKDTIENYMEGFLGYELKERHY